MDQTRQYCRTTYHFFQYKITAQDNVQNRSKLEFRAVGVNKRVETTGYVLVNNVWQNLVFTFRNDPTDGQVVDTYINGEKINTTLGVNTPNCPNGVWSIGASITYNGTTVTDHTNGFVGLIDSLNVFNGSF